MNIIPLSSLGETDFFVRGLDVCPAIWAERKKFLSYAFSPRPFCALFFVMEDISCVFSEEGQTPVKASKGDILYIPSHIMYRAFFKGGKKESPLDSYTVNFTLLDESREPFLLFPHITKITNRPPHLLEERLTGLWNSIYRLPSHNSFTVKGLFYELLGAILPAPEKDSFFAIRKGVDLLESEWNKNEKISRYAKISGISEGYFYRLFQACMGVTPIEYRNKIRIRAAKTMLQNSEMQIAEISALVGFEDSFYFSKAFKKALGLSPRAYRSRERYGQPTQERVTP
ncbi:MAG: helix-turn-helix transcriptional regulator [Clostridia bacterium]|nr:helix-turn-helix transcriptional regulator [Clostridia bacterium]